MDTVFINISEVPVNVAVNAISTSDIVSINTKEVLGKDGASAYELAVVNGFVGNVAAWLLSLRGATGAVGGVFAFAQSTPLSVWNVNHNLGYYPNVSVVDSTGEKVYGDIHYVNINNVQLSFVGSFSGNAYLT